MEHDAGCAGQTAFLTADGKAINCDTVFIGTGGHRFAPGFQLRGYTTGERDDPQVQLLYVECKGVTASSGSDGIIYGVYETLDIVEIPLTPPNESA